MTTLAFQKLVWSHFDSYARDLPWRRPEADGSFDAYKIMVSEVMLQQTQVSRVLPKFEQFLKRFPTAQRLAGAPLNEVLAAWSGLGYNRRAKYLHQAAKQLSGQAQPWIYDDLVALPGIGPNTAKAVQAYAYDLPVSFIETNIRTVYLHHFFADQTKVTDAEVLRLVEQTLPKGDYRRWYWALMDYGSQLKRQVGSQLDRSRHYSRQAAFVGSRRQLRGQILKLLIATAVPAHTLSARLPDERLPDVLTQLQAEGLITQSHDRYRLAS